MCFFFFLPQVLEGDYTLTFEPRKGYLDPRKEMSIKLTFTGHKKVTLNCGFYHRQSRHC